MTTHEKRPTPLSRQALGGSVGEDLTAMLRAFAALPQSGAPTPEGAGTFDPPSEGPWCRLETYGVTSCATETTNPLTSRNHPLTDCSPACRVNHAAQPGMTETSDEAGHNWLAVVNRGQRWKGGRDWETKGPTRAPLTPRSQPRPERQECAHLSPSDRPLRSAAGSPPERGPNLRTELAGDGSRCTRRCIDIGAPIHLPSGCNHATLRLFCSAYALLVTQERSPGPARATPRQRLSFTSHPRDPTAGGLTHPLRCSSPNLDADDTPGVLPVHPFSRVRTPYTPALPAHTTAPEASR